MTHLLNPVIIIDSSPVSRGYNCTQFITVAFDGVFERVQDPWDCSHSLKNRNLCVSFRFILGVNILLYTSSNWWIWAEFYCRVNFLFSRKVYFYSFVCSVDLASADSSPVGVRTVSFQKALFWVLRTAQSWQRIRVQL